MNGVPGPARAAQQHSIDRPAPTRASKRPRAEPAGPRSDDTVVHELDRMADRVGASRAQQIIGPGERLGSALQARMETRLGVPVGTARIHREPAAARVAAALGVAAFTLGEHVVLAGAMSNSDPHGAYVLAHELAHTVQQSGAARSTGHPGRTVPDGPEERGADLAARGLVPPARGARLAIAAAPGPSPPASRPFAELWPLFQRASYQTDRPRATALAKELAIASSSSEDLVLHGIDVVVWLQRNGEEATADRLLEDVRSAWMLRAVSAGVTLPSRSTLSWNASDPRTLIALGEEAARNERHDDAFHFFGVANEILSFYALEASARRGSELADENAEAARRQRVGAGDASRKAVENSYARVLQYADLEDVYASMREIYGFYHVLEREALEQGDAARAASLRQRATALHETLTEKFSWSQAQPPGPMSQQILTPVEIAEVSYTDTPKGPGLTLHGANSAETDLTELPGLPSSKEVGNNIQVQNLGALQHALTAQTEFQAEIARRPEIRKAFGGTPIDLQDTRTRQRVWRIMYGTFKAAGPGALGSLMALVGRYLKAFTIHTTFNVRDWGTSYLDSKMPTDLAGRTEQDCGVYALTVAWDVFQTVRQADAKLDVDFTLVTMLEHVTLVISDRSTGEFYVVSNDEVSPAHTGDPLTQIAPIYGAVRGLDYTVGPAVTVDLGSTRDAPQRFHDGAWSRYLASVDWGLDVDEAASAVKDPSATSPADPQADPTRSRYKTFYQDQELFDHAVAALDTQVDALRPAADDPAKLGLALAPLADRARVLVVGFASLGPGVGLVSPSASTRALLRNHRKFLFTQAQGHTVYPLARVALAVMRLKALGGVTTAAEDDVAAFCVGEPELKREMDSFQQAGGPTPF